MAYRNNFDRLIAIICAIVCIVAFAASIYISSYEANGNITERTYNAAKNDPDTIGTSEVAVAILHEADVEYSDYFDQAFIASAKKHTVTVYYKRYDPIKNRNYHFIEVDTGDVDAKEFVENYFTEDYFDDGYGVVVEWEFEKKSRTKYTAYLTLDDYVVDSAEDYAKMKERELVTDGGLFVARLGQSMPIPVYDSFFVMDSKTRMVGWFYFRTYYNGQEYYACFEVSGWDSKATYEEVVDGTDYKVASFNSTRIWVEKCG